MNEKRRRRTLGDVHEDGGAFLVQAMNAIVDHTSHSERGTESDGDLWRLKEPCLCCTFTEGLAALLIVCFISPHMFCAGLICYCCTLLVKNHEACLSWSNNVWSINAATCPCWCLCDHHVIQHDATWRPLIGRSAIATSKTDVQLTVKGKRRWLSQSWHLRIYSSCGRGSR